MAVRTISTSIKLDGEQEFKKQMSSVNSELKNLKSEMALATAEFKGNANSMDALTAKGRVLQQQYAQQAEKVKALEKAVADASDAYGEADKRTDDYRRQLNYAKAALYDLNREIQENERYLDEAKRSADQCASSIDEYGREVKEAAKDSGSLSFTSPFAGLDDMVSQVGALKSALVGGAAVGAVAAGAQALVGAIVDIVDSTQEYRKVMGTLEVSSRAAGYTAEETAYAYERLYAVLGDNQTAATTVANLQAIGLSQEDLVFVIDSAIGAWSRYGDSIPIDALAEGINETISAGTATSAFSDVLVWAKVNEDDFNAKLQAANSTTERANIVLQELARQGLAEAGQAWRDINDDIVQVNESQARFDEAKAKLGEALAPIKSFLLDAGATFIEAQVSMEQQFQDGWVAAFGTVEEKAEYAQKKAEEAARESEHSLQGTKEAIDANVESLSALTEKTEEQQEAEGYLTQAEDLLSRALEEQNENKSLSLGTTLSLIDAGYAAAITIDQETGAVTLNKDAYVAITQAKIDDQIASLETQRVSVQNAIAMRDEALMATDLGKSYYSAAEARKALEGQEASYDAQIAALNQLKKTIGSVTVATTSSARRSTSASRQAASASKKVKTQAEKDLEQFRDMTSELDHLRKMDEISEEEYYDKLSEYRDRYLTDDANIEEYRKVTEEIYQYDKSLAEKEAKLWEDQTQYLADELQDRVDAILDHQQEMEDALSGYGDLFKVEDDDLSLNDIQKQIDAINEYEQALSQLKERGVASGLMDAVLNMDVDDATQYAQELLALSEEQFSAYNDLWQEKQQRAKEVAEEFYSDQLEALGTEYNSKLGETLSELTGTAFDSGQDTVQGLLDGLSSKEQAVYQKAQEMVNTISEILAQVNVQTEITLPAGAAAPVDGSHAGGLTYVPWDGYIAQLHQGERVLTAEQARTMDALFSGAGKQPAGVTVEDMRSVTASAVNAMGAMGGTGGRYVIELHWNVNGKELYRETIEDFRAVNKEIPEVLDDR